MLHHAITEFGRRMGLSELALSDEDRVALDVNGLGRLYVEYVHAGPDARLLLCLARPMPVHEAHRRRAALELCHYSHGHVLPLAAGMRGDDLLLLTWLVDSELHGAALENAVRFLSGMADRIFAA